MGGGFFAFFYFKKRSRAMRHWLDRMSLKLPIIGGILQKAAIARYARTLSTMFSAGVPLVEALESVAGACGNIVYEIGVLEMRDEVATGQRLQQALDMANGKVPYRDMDSFVTPGAWIALSTMPWTTCRACSSR